MRHMDLKIKPLPAAHLPAALALCREVFLEFEAPDYPPEGIAAFLDFLEPGQMRRMTASGILSFWGAYCGKRLIGVGALREARHISLLFVRREMHRKGAGTALMREMFACCAGAGETRVTVHAAPYGEPFYRALGFSPTAPEQCQDGITYIPMERKL